MSATEITFVPAVGDRAEPRQFGPITRTDFVRYQGASGDFHPLHHDETYAHASGFPTVFSVGMFQAGYAELSAQLRVPGQTPASPGAPAPRPTLRSITAVDRALLRASSIEVNKLENRVTFLATTASITPFIGLFGTVWGIMTAFMNIGAQGSTDLAVVSTPIAEALIATALGLFAAIPAVYFYNHFTSKVKSYASEMDDFALEFLNISERNFT